MTLRYYLSRFFWGFFFVTASFFSVYSSKGEVDITMWSIALVISCFLYPYSIKMVSVLMLMITTPEFWKKGLFRETAGKSGLYAIFYLFCFTVAMPMAIVYFVFFLCGKSVK
jgi:hypothetical protein